MLLAQPDADASRVAAIGYCFGGTMALELARGGADLKAVVGFHSGLRRARPEDAQNIKGRVLVCIGAEDPLIPPDQRTAFEEEMRGGRRRLAHEPLWRRRPQLHEPQRRARRACRASSTTTPTDARSWTAMRDLFDEALGPV